MSGKYTEEELLIATQIAYYNFDPAIINELTYENNGYSPTLQKILERDRAIFDAQQSDPSAYPGIKTIYEERCYLDPDKTSSAYDIERTDAARERYESIKSGEICQNWTLVDYHNENSTTGLVGCLIETGLNSDGKNGAIIAYRGSESDNLQQVLLDWGISDIGLLSAYETLQQKSVEKYTQFVSDYYGDKYDYVATSGHSLGGALSFHSALTAPQELWEKIVQAYSMDGPGTSEEYLMTHADYIARMATRPDVMQHRGWSWVGTLLFQLPCADYKWLQVSDAMSDFLLFIAIFKKANNKRKRQTNAGNPAAKQNRVPYEPRQGAGPDFGPSIHEGGPSSWTTSSQWDSDRDCRAEGTELSSPFPPGPPGQPLHGESAYCPSQQCLRA